MNAINKRYSKIKEKLPREFILIQGKGCFWKKCCFCDYFNDISENSFEINSKIIEKVTGEFGVLDVINSGSIMEVDERTLDLLIKKIEEKSISEVWFEAHWAYKNKLSEFAKKFKNSKVKFRIGVETFNTNLRKSWNKGISESVTPKEISDYFQSVNLLVGIKGQTFEDITSDIKIANEYFERFIINIFVENSTPVLRDEHLIKRFIKEIYPKIKDNKKIETLIENTDLGVG